jgi:hypothetical protein
LRAMAQEMTTTTSISITALLDWSSENKRVALTQTKEQKAKGHIISHGFLLFGGHYLLSTTAWKDENDHQGGEPQAELPETGWGKAMAKAWN